MITKNIINKILWSTIEDYSGLWEIVWEINSLIEGADSRAIAKEVLALLKNHGLIEYYFAKWGQEGLKKISESEMRELLEEDQYWAPPSIDQDCMKVGTTQKGEEYYYEDKIRSTSPFLP